MKVRYILGALAIMFMGISSSIYREVYSLETRPNYTIARETRTNLFGRTITEEFYDRRNDGRVDTYVRDTGRTVEKLERPGEFGCNFLPTATEVASISCMQQEMLQSIDKRFKEISERASVK